jgi:hypothetical protein
LPGGTKRKQRPKSITKGQVSPRRTLVKSPSRYSEAGTRALGSQLPLLKNRAEARDLLGCRSGYHQPDRILNPTKRLESFARLGLPLIGPPSIKPSLLLGHISNPFNYIRLAYYFFVSFRYFSWLLGIYFIISSCYLVVPSGVLF